MSAHTLSASCRTQAGAGSGGASAPDSDVLVAALYRFTRLDDPASEQRRLARALCAAGVRGTLLVAAEGVNGTIAGDDAAIAAALAAIALTPGCEDIAPRLSRCARMPFGRLKVRLKREIVTFHADTADPLAADPLTRVGAYVPPEAWNAVIADPETVVIDVRNAFEVTMGSFVGAEDPGTDTFSAFADWFRRRHAQAPARRYAMFCTGGIRCEKATSFAMSVVGDAAEVSHLEGGILAYLATIAPSDSLWRGGCFVFDERVALGHGLAPIAPASDKNDPTG